MQEELVKTSWRQRLVAILVSAVLLFTSMAVYIATVINGGANSSTGSSEEYQTKYYEKQDEIAKALSPLFYDELYSYLSKVKAFNADSMNKQSLTTKDLKEGTGTEIGEDSAYYAYYIGWCANETIFDSSFNPDKTALNAPLNVSSDMRMIEGWEKGILGMKAGGVREIDIPGELAYGDTQEICGSYNAPLKFIVMPIDIPSEVAPLYVELDDLYSKWLSAYYKEMSSQSANQTVDVTDSEDVTQE